MEKDYKFIVYRSKKAISIFVIVGVSLVSFGLMFIYMNSVSPTNFYKWTAVISLIIGLKIIYDGIRLIKKPIISVSKERLWFDISIYKESSV